MTNVNENTHPFLDTYQNWICEGSDPNSESVAETLGVQSYNEYLPS